MKNYGVPLRGTFFNPSAQRTPPLFTFHFSLFIFLVPSLTDARIRVKIPSVKGFDGERGFSIRAERAVMG